MARKADNSKNYSNIQTRSKGQRGLALAVLVIILFLAAFFTMGDDTGLGRLRNSLYRQIGLIQEEPEPESEPVEAEPVSSGGTAETAGTAGVVDSSNLPEFEGRHYTVINGNEPVFPAEAYEIAGLINSNGRWKTEGTIRGVDPNKLNPFEYYGELDKMGRCTQAYGCLGIETMPAQGEQRGDISSVHPSGWAKAQGWERSHLIAWALSNENANDRNLVTGTHYMNYDGMRPLEEEVEHYIWDTGNHVLYLAKPVFSGKELVPRGVQMMAWSVEDEGEGICFNVFCFNVTPGATIDYKTGIVTTAEQATQDARKYVINTRSKVFHYPSCEGAQQMSKHNRKEVTATRVELTNQGYTPCGACEP